MRAKPDGACSIHYKRTAIDMSQIPVQLNTEFNRDLQIDILEELIARENWKNSCKMNVNHGRFAGHFDRRVICGNFPREQSDHLNVL